MNKELRLLSDDKIKIGLESSFITVEISEDFLANYIISRFDLPLVYNYRKFCRKR